MPNYFRHFFILSLFLILFIGCSSKKEPSFTIEGNVSNLEKNFVVLSIIEDIQNNKTSVIDTLKVNNNGEFKMDYFLEPNIYALTFDGIKTINLAIDKGQHISVNGNSPDDLRISGSVDTDLLNAYETFRNKSLDRLVNSVRNEIKALQKGNAIEGEIAELRELEVENYKKHLNELMTFVKEKMGTSIAVYPTSIRWIGGEYLPFLKELVGDFEKKYPALNITEKLKDRLQLLKKTSVGGIISGIEMPNSSNEMINLNNIQKKYTLIDFWASWCPPCRTESKLLKNLYDAYNAKGFEIYGISLDSKRERWLNAIANDNRIWTEVSTVEGFKTKVSIEYGITSLPTNFLIDASGKIIAVNIHGQQLKEKIDELFLEN
ncbi:thioredoxin-like domain-containing protein [Lutibacter sp.]|uniref:thioredoxin-like domain-containing protein n=1 Tax=Lutibacter sp. TaxID=1925666 RepID=UPI0035662EDE